MAPKRSSSDSESSSEHEQEDLTVAPSAQNSDESQTDKDGADSDQSDHSDQETPKAEPAAQRPARVAGLAIKPIKSRPMDSISGSKKPSRASVSHPRSKRTKLVSSSPYSPPKGGRVSKRYWGKEDEIVLLHGLVDYRVKKGYMPGGASKHMEAFHHFIKGSLGIKVSTVQLSDKIRGLKRKFNQAILRGKGETDQSFSDSHEKTLFVLSQTIWGPNDIPLDLPNPLISDDDTDKDIKDIDNDSPPANHTENGHFKWKNGNTSGNVVYPYLTEMVDNISKDGLNGALLKRAFAGVNGSKAMAMEKKIKKFRIDEMQLGLRKVELMEECYKELLDVVKKSE